MSQTPRIRYTVQEDDTVSSVALKFQMTADALRELNPEILPKGNGCFVQRCQLSCKIVDDLLGENRVLYPGTVLVVALKHEEDVAEQVEEVKDM